MRIIEYFTKLNSLETLCQPLNTKIYIGPQHKVLILRKDYKTAEQYSTIFEENGSYLNSWTSYFCVSNRPLHIDLNIKHHAKQILERTDQLRMKENEKKQFQHRIIQMENDLQQMRRMVKQHETTILKKLKEMSHEMHGRRFYL